MVFFHPLPPSGLLWLLLMLLLLLAYTSIPDNNPAQPRNEKKESNRQQVANFPTDIVNTFFRHFCDVPRLLTEHFTIIDHKIC